MFSKQNLSTDLASCFNISLVVHTTSYNFPTPGRKSHKSPLSGSLVAFSHHRGRSLLFWKSPIRITSTSFLFFAAFVEQVLFCFSICWNIQVWKKFDHIWPQSSRALSETWVRDSQGDCDSMSFTPGCNQGQDEPQVKGAAFPIISVPIILRWILSPRNGRWKVWWFE